MQRLTSKTGLISAGLVALGGLIAVTYLWSPAPASSSETVTSKQPVPAFEGTAPLAGWALFRPGERTVLDVHYRAENKTRLSAPGADAAESTVSGALTLDAVLAVDAARGASGGTVLDMSFTQCSAGRLVFGDAAVFDGASACTEALVGPTLRAEVDVDGRVTRVTPAAPDLAGQTLKAIAAELQFVIPASIVSDDDYDTVDVTALGEVVSHVATTENGDRVRTRGAYTRFVSDAALSVTAHDGQSSTTLKRDGRGRLEAFMHTEQAVGKSKSGEVRLSAKSLLNAKVRTRGAAALVAAARTGRSYTLDAVMTSDGLQERAALAQAEGLTRPAAAAMLRDALASGELPAHRRALWRINGVLQSEPGLIADVEAMFGAPGATVRGKGLLLDVLTSDGSDAAQQALRRMLNSDAAQDDAAFPHLYQRLSLLDTPSPETFEATFSDLDNAASGRENERLLYAFTLGSMVAKADGVSDARKDAANATLREHLAQSTSPAHRAQWVKAVSNTRRAENQEALIALTTDGDRRVRESVARGLRRPATDEGRVTLLSLVRDPASGVQVEALRALRHHTLDAQDIRTLATGLTDARLNPLNARELLDLMKYQGKNAPDAAKTLLSALIAQSEDGEVIAAARALHETL